MWNSKHRVGEEKSGADSSAPLCLSTPLFSWGTNGVYNDIVTVAYLFHYFKKVFNSFWNDGCVISEEKQGWQLSPSDFMSQS